MEPNQVAHVVVFPAPAQGHVNSMLKLAELLCLSNLHVTFVNTEHYHHRLLKYTDVQARFSVFPLFRFETVPDGFPDYHPRSIAYANEMLEKFQSVMQPAFKQLLVSDHMKSRPPVTCIIADGLMGASIDVANELKIPSIAFRTASACHLWSCFCYQKLVDAGEIPFDDADLDKLVTSIPGMETFLRKRDFPSFYRAKDLSDQFLQVATTATMSSTRASATIHNTFDDLEGPILSTMAPHFPKSYTIGPLHAHLSYRLSLESSPSISSNSLWEVDRSCMSWLDSQPSKSVVYVSFGSIVSMTHVQMLEFWYGLVNSGKRFLWVIRPNSVTENEEDIKIPAYLTEGTKEKGYMVGWCPQEEVLVHPAVAGFVTHSGWNSTLESIVAGIPMVCWPHVGDQPINSRFVEEVWRIGLDMKDTCDRSTVEMMVNDLMDHKRDELMISMGKMSEMARKSVSKGGSSYSNLDALIEDIKAMNFQV
ncbi:7-deoxyloganetic acid glucosyltransferase [Ranunculus cassubicifolius]